MTYASEYGSVTDLGCECSVKRPGVPDFFRHPQGLAHHDEQHLVGWQAVKRNLDRLTVLTADKGYDWADPRSLLREHGDRPVTKHRVFDSLDKAHNARINDDVYHQRSTVESVIRVLKRRYGDRLTSRTWYGQFRELAIKAAVKNIDTGIGASHC